MNLSTTRLEAFSSFFSSTVVRELASKRKSPRLIRLALTSGILEQVNHAAQVSDLFDAAFKVLKRRGCRDEYIYKAALTHRVLLGKHNLSTASMLTEFRAGECRADIAILNGTMTVYEIKSERDSLSRLKGQIQSYRRVFANIFVIAGENHIGEILRATPADVGVMSLSSRYNISIEREAIHRPEQICPVTVFDSLRVAEAKDIITQLGREVPSVPNTQIHTTLRELFRELRPEDVHAAMIPTLKKSRSLLPLAALVDQLPASLQPAALMVPLRKMDHDRLVAAIETPLQIARGWV